MGNLDNMGGGYTTPELIAELDAMLAPAVTQTPEVSKNFFDEFSSDLGGVDEIPPAELILTPRTLEENNARARNEAKAVRADYVVNFRRIADAPLPPGFEPPSE